jgi:hypothetical protein
MAYVFAFGLATPYVMEFPARLAAGRVSRRGIAGRPVTRGMGLGLVFVLQALGFVCWFVLCLVPIKFSNDMNALHPLALWFGVPFFIGVGIAVLVRQGTKRRR